jgi:predicted DNA-binding helix-hairpin-helix protein
MIIGADATDDSTILHTAAFCVWRLSLAQGLLFRLQPNPAKPQYSALPRVLSLQRASPVPGGLSMRAGMVSMSASRSHGSGNPVSIDPETGLALNNREHFPVDLNRAEPHDCPSTGIGVLTAKTLGCSCAGRNVISL